MILLVIELVANLGAQLIVRRYARRQRSGALMAARPRVEPDEPADDRSGNLRRRRRVDRLMRGGATAAALLAVAVLVIVIVDRRLARRQRSSALDFLTKDPRDRPRHSRRRHRHAIVGSALIVAVATAMALPSAC